MSKTELLKRYVIFIIGLCLSSLGICLATKAGLGTSPISSMPYVLSFILPITFGQLTFIVNLCMLFCQILILKKDFQKVQLLQIVIAFALGSFIDIYMRILAFLNTANYLSQIVILLLGCIIIGLGISLQVLANVIMLPGEALVKTISTRFNRDFGTVKTIFDTSLVVISIVISLTGLGRIAGLREGTVIAALIVGSISRFFINRLCFIHTFLQDKPVNEPMEEYEVI